MCDANKMISNNDPSGAGYPYNNGNTRPTHSWGSKIPTTEMSEPNHSPFHTPVQQSQVNSIVMSSLSTPNHQSLSAAPPTASVSGGGEDNSLKKRLSALERLKSLSFSVAPGTGPKKLNLFAAPSLQEKKHLTEEELRDLGATTSVAPPKKRPDSPPKRNLNNRTSWRDAPESQGGNRNSWRESPDAQSGGRANRWDGRPQEGTAPLFPPNLGQSPLGRGPPRNFGGSGPPDFGPDSSTNYQFQDRFLHPHHNQLPPPTHLGQQSQPNYRNRHYPDDMEHHSPMRGDFRSRGGSSPPPLQHDPHPDDQLSPSPVKSVVAQEIGDERIRNLAIDWPDLEPMTKWKLVGLVEKLQALELDLLKRLKEGDEQIKESHHTMYKEQNELHFALTAKATHAALQNAIENTNTSRIPSLLDLTLAPPTSTGSGGTRPPFPPGNPPFPFPPMGMGPFPFAPHLRHPFAGLVSSFLQPRLSAPNPAIQRPPPPRAPAPPRPPVPPPIPQILLRGPPPPPRPPIPPPGLALPPPPPGLRPPTVPMPRAPPPLPHGPRPPMGALPPRLPPPGGLRPPASGVGVMPPRGGARGPGGNRPAFSKANANSGGKRKGGQNNKMNRVAKRKKQNSGQGRSKDSVVVVTKEDKRTMSDMVEVIPEHYDVIRGSQSQGPHGDADEAVGVGVIQSIFGSSPQTYPPDPTTGGF